MEPLKSSYVIGRSSSSGQEIVPVASMHIPTSSTEVTASSTPGVSSARTSTLSTPPMPFRVWSGNRKIKKSLVGKSCADVIVKAAAKMEISDISECRLVLESCGTEVDDDEYLSLLPSNCVLMFLQAGEKWSHPLWSPSSSEGTATFNFPPTSNSTVAKLSQGTFPFPVKAQTSKSPEITRSPSGSREGSLPIPSPTAFASLKSFTIDGSLPSVFSIPAGGNVPYSASSTTCTNLPASPFILSVPPQRGGGEGAAIPQQQQQPPPHSIPQQSRQDLSLPPKDDFTVTSSDTGAPPTGILIAGQNGLVGVGTGGTASNGHGLTPIILSSSQGSEMSPVHVDGITAETGPIYAIGPLGPFFVAAGNVGGCSNVTTKADSPTNYGGLMIGNGAGGSGFSSGGGNFSGTVAINVSGATGKEKCLSSDGQEIVNPPIVANAEEMVELKKNADERFKRKSKNLPCSVLGCSKTFRDEYDRKTHLRCHTGERPYKCFSCDKRFAHVSSRIHHHKTLHLNKREFICSVCGKSFVKRIEAQRHQWTAHRIPSAPPSRTEGAIVVDSTTSDLKSQVLDKIK